MTVTIDRLIYTAGTLKFNDDIRQCRKIWVYADVLRRPPSAVYQNERINPTKRFYGYVSLMIDEYVVSVKPLEYDQQLVFEYDNLHYQLFKTINCSTALIIDAIAALGSVMTPPAIVIPINVTPPPFPGCPYVWLKFKLEPLTRIKVVAFGDEAIGCDGVDFPVSLPDFPPPPPPYPPTRPLIEDPPRSEPEEGENPDDTKPADEDDPDSSLIPPEFPIGAQCETYVVAIQATIAGEGTIQSSSITVFGKVEYVGFNPENTNQIIVVSYGDALAPGAFCRTSPITFVRQTSSVGYVPGSLVYTVT